ncbi:hypothetical protein LCGC14_2089620, partial [marine sediment metagenome]
MKKLLLYIGVLCLFWSGIAHADKIVYNVGTASGNTGFVPSFSVQTTLAGVSQWVRLDQIPGFFAGVNPANVDDYRHAGGFDSYAFNRNLGSMAVSGGTNYSNDNATGLLVHRAANEPKIEYFAGNPGFHMFSGHTNYVIEGVNFNSTSWSKTRSSVVASLSQETPLGDGTSGISAYFLKEDGTAGNNHNVAQTIANAVFTDNSIYTISAFVHKDSSHNWVRLTGSNKDNSVGNVFFNVATGVIGNQTGVSNAWISNEPVNGYYRISMTEMMGSAANDLTAFIYLAESNGVISYDGNNTSGATIFGFQVVQQPSAMPWNPTYEAAYINTGNAGGIRVDIPFTGTTIEPSSTGSVFAEELGAEIAAGALTIGNLYKITADNLEGHWFASSVTDNYFVEISGTTNADANNKVKHVTNAYDPGQGLSPPNGSMLVGVRWGYPYDQASSADQKGMVAIADSTQTILFNNGSAGDVRAYDGSGTIGK